jgi:hypothetical protein
MKRIASSFGRDWSRSEEHSHGSAARFGPYPTEPLPRFFLEGKARGALECGREEEGLNTGPLAALAAAVAVVAIPSAFAADQADAPATLDFFSSGGGAHAGWTADSGSRALEIHVTETGYAGAEVHAAAGLSTSSVQGASYELKAAAPGPSLGSPRLVIRFSDGGSAQLRPLAWTTTWQRVGDPNWDNRGGSCGPFRFQTTWRVIQSCHAGTSIVDEYLTTDPGKPNDFLIDELHTAGND